MSNRSLAFSIAAFACACGPAQNNGHGDDDGSGGGGGGGGGGEIVDGLACSKMDILFVIDNSGSMDQEQSNLIANFPHFISVLDESGLDYRVAVTTTSRNYTFNIMVGTSTIPLTTTGESGEMLKKGTMTKRWIDKGDPDVAGKFSTLANVGISGSGTEMPLGALRDAFEDRMMDGTNMGFRRPDALLGIVILTDEDDCSYEQPVTLSDASQMCTAMMEPTASYKMFLDQYTGSPTRWAIAMIAGPGPGTCSSAFGEAVEATRLIDLKGKVGANAIMSSICDGDLSVGLMQATQLFQSACGGIIL
ncbi:MAG TPA: vWA domain-containing protein [Kofleriaceae bacterium]